MTEIIKLVLSLSISGSIMAVLILSFKPFLKHKLPKTIQYYIWIIVLLRFVTPFTLEESLMNKLFYKEKPSAQAVIQGTAAANQSQGNALALSANMETEKNVNLSYSKKSIDYVKALKYLLEEYGVKLWLYGGIAVIIFNLAGYFRFLHFINKKSKPAKAFENEILYSLSEEKTKLKLIRNSYAVTPMLIGIIRPRIVIPDEEYNETQLRNIIMHELMHYKHYDILVKWLTMTAVSVHWFNPLIYFIRREINHACELSCDEAVIKNLTPREKQSYGDTLIAVASEQKYSKAVLGATMSEDKKTLKDRLVSIMKHSKKTKLTIVFSVVLLVLIVIAFFYLGAGREGGKEVPPNLFISAEEQKTKMAVIGSYDWSYRGKHIIADSSHPSTFKYKAADVVSARSSEQLVIGTQKLNKDKKYNFTLEEVSVYKEGKPIVFKTVEPSFMNGFLYLQGPTEAGEYIYDLKLNFKDRGTVTYAFVVRVDMLTYDLEEISKHKTPYIGNISKVSALVRSIPVPHSSYKQRYIALKTDSRPYKLNVFYERRKEASNNSQIGDLSADKAVYSNMQKNALVLFCMIDNLDELSFNFRGSESEGKLESDKYDTAYSFKREDIEKIYGSLASLSTNLDLLKKALDK